MKQPYDDDEWATCLWWERKWSSATSEKKGEKEQKDVGIFQVFFF